LAMSDAWDNVKSRKMSKSNIDGESILTLIAIEKKKEQEP
jgi:hypothetical protein